MPVESMRLIARALAVVAVGLLFAGACGGGSGGGDAGGGATGSGGSSGAGGGGCGGVSCGGNQVCVHPSCGGGVAVCVPLGDAGQCPSGWTQVQCPSGPGCTPPPCTPPAPHCADVPAACSGTPSCTCLPNDICQQSNGQYGGFCTSVSGGQVICLSA